MRDAVRTEVTNCQRALPAKLKFKKQPPGGRLPEIIPLR